MFSFQSPQQKLTRKNSVVEESWEEEKARRDAEEKEREEQLSKEEKEKASLVASFFGGTAKPVASGLGKPAAVAASWFTLSVFFFCTFVLDS